MQSDYSILKDMFKINEKNIDRLTIAEEEVQPILKLYNSVKEFNQYKVLHAMQESGLNEQHFQWATGYGYDDAGREKLEEVYARVFKTEDAIVRPTIVNGTHALSLTLSALLNSGDEMLSVTGSPYDTLHELIGITGNYSQSLKKIGVIYKEIDFLESGDVNYKAIEKKVKSNTKLVYIQRSTGYAFRKAIDITSIEKIIKIVKMKNKNTICMIDNCYGEFLETREPTEVGADILAGSLIKNPGGGLALTGGYVVGKKSLIEDISYRMTSPGIGKECGLTFGLSRSLFQGFFIAPHVVIEALRGAILCSKLFENEGYLVSPKYNEPRSDIIQGIQLNNKDKVIAFCKAVQEAAPVNAFVSPEPWAMPGYNDPVIMAAGTFIQGSSIELSADAPIREPYNVYFQGGLTYEHAKLGAVKALQSVI
ncbi:methionine gamma-lyase family protein [Alkaliphilus sp. AH-315-G20]|nr:methionine gamma-lyase family protein [Alkaliphilus sp. AH-315-G20]